MNDQNNGNYHGNQYGVPPQQGNQGGYPPQQPVFIPQQGGYPNQYPQAPMQQPMQQQQAPQQPQGGYPPQQPMQQQAPQQPQMLQQMPFYHRPDEQSMLAAYQEQRNNSGGSGFNYVKFPPDDWSTVQVGYKSVIRAYLLPPFAEGRHIFSITKNHFWKSIKSPKGKSIVCPGDGSCEICNASSAALSSSDSEQQKRAKDWGRVKTNYLYQVGMLDSMGSHFQTNPPKPFILQAGAKLHGHIGNLIEDKSISICDPQQGRPLRLKREKTGMNTKDIGYSCTDEDPSPLPQPLWILLNNLFDLDFVTKIPTREEMLEAVIDMGLQPSNASQNPYAVQTQMVPQQMPVNVQPQQQSIPNLVQPGGYNTPPIDVPLNPPPINTQQPQGGNAQPYYQQPSQHQAQAPTQVQRNPVVPSTSSANEGSQVPTTLEDLQKAAVGPTK